MIFLLLLHCWRRLSSTCKRTKWHISYWSSFARQTRRELVFSLNQITSPYYYWVIDAIVVSILLSFWRIKRLYSLLVYLQMMMTSYIRLILCPSWELFFEVSGWVGRFWLGSLIFTSQWHEEMYIVFCLYSRYCVVRRAPYSGFLVPIIVDTLWVANNRVQVLNKDTFQIWFVVYWTKPDWSPFPRRLWNNERMSSSRFFWKLPVGLWLWRWRFWWHTSVISSYLLGNI